MALHMCDSEEASSLMNGHSSNGMVHLFIASEANLYVFLLKLGVRTYIYTKPHRFFNLVN
jgi:hypothetical protein